MVPRPQLWPLVSLPWLAIVAAVLTRRSILRQPPGGSTLFSRLCSRDRPYCPISRLVLAALWSCALVATTLTATSGPRSAVWSGVPLQQVVRLGGRVVGDPQSFDGRTRIPVALSRVAERSGRSASGRGTIQIVWDGDQYLAAPFAGRAQVIRGDAIEIAALRGLSRGQTVVSTSQSAVRIVARGPLGLLRGRLRTAILQRLARLSSRANGLVTALVLGDRSALDPLLARRLRRSGASHALALSGMHLSVLGLLFARALRPFTAWFAPRVGAVTVGVLLTGYVWLAGWIPSLLRALVLYWLLTLRPRDGFVLALARTVCLVALLAPESVGHLGFRLSVLALLGIVLAAPVLRPRSGRLDRLWRYLSVSAGAVAGTMLLSLQTFGVLAVGGVLAAGILGALVLVIMWLGLALLLVAHLPIIGTVTVQLTELCCEALYALAGFTARSPQLSGAVAWIVVVAGGAVLVLCFVSRLHSADRDESQLAF